MIAWQKAVTLKEPLAAATAYIPTLTQMQINILAKCTHVLYLLLAVVVYMICFRIAARALMLTSWQFNLNMTAII